MISWWPKNYKCWQISYMNPQRSKFFLSVCHLMEVDSIFPTLYSETQDLLTPVPGYSIFLWIRLFHSLLLWFRWELRYERARNCQREPKNISQRPYHAECTSSRPITEVKQHWALLVLGWETAWEHRVLLAFCFFSQQSVMKQKI